jgi:hypothetical protein
MKKVILASAGLLVVAGAASYFGFGGYDISAVNRHWPIVEKSVAFIRDRSVHAHAQGMVVPADFEDTKRLAEGAEHFRSHCTVCHGDPSDHPEEFTAGMYPRPADLKKVARTLRPQEVFWVIRNGIKMSGMPSFADHSDDETWSIVALVEKLPDMQAEEFKALQPAQEPPAKDVEKALPVGPADAPHQDPDNHGDDDHSAGHPHHHHHHHKPQPNGGG